MTRRQASASSSVILYPGYLYYLPARPWRGIRIAREATMMRGPAGGGGPQLIPLARFDGDWSGFLAAAERLILDGAKPMSFRLLEHSRASPLL